MSHKLILNVGRFISSIRVLFIGMLCTMGIVKGTDQRGSFPSTKRVKDQFEHEASIYDASRDVWVHGYKGRCERTLIGKFLAGSSVLEIGVGTGRIMTRFANGCNYYGIDISCKMLEKAKDKARIQKLDVELIVMDGEHLGFRHTAFDSVITSRTLKYLQNPTEALLEAKRISRTNGRCIITCETSDTMWQRMKSRGFSRNADIRFSISEIVGMLQKAGFDIIGIRPLPSLLSPYYGGYKVVRLLDKILSRVRIGAWIVIGESDDPRIDSNEA